MSMRIVGRLACVVVAGCVSAAACSDGGSEADPGAGASAGQNAAGDASVSGASFAAASGRGGTPAGGSSSMAGTDAGGTAGDAGGGMAGDASGGAAGDAGNAASGAAGADAAGGAAGVAGDGGSAGAPGGDAGAAGTAGAGGAPAATSVCDGFTKVLPLAEAYIDNFETEARFQGWYSFSDTLPPQTPAFARDPSTGALQTTFSGHVAHEDILPTNDKGYGAGVGFNLLDVSTKCLDVSAFDGISFWAKGTSGKTSQVKLQFIVPATQPRDSLPEGDCDPSDDCAYQHPATTITLQNDWTHYVVPFSTLASAVTTFGGRAQGFNIITGAADTSWEIWLDEVTFYQGKAPAGPVTP
jgi:hypothetical protein